MKKVIYQAIIFILIFSSYLMAQQQDVWRTFNTSDGLADNWIHAVCESSDGAMWFGTNFQGVSRYQNGIWTTFDTTDGLAANYVFAIYESSDGALWFGTGDPWVAKGKKVTQSAAQYEGKGVSRYHNGIWTTFNTNSGLAHNNVSAIYESSDSTLWFGTGRGVSQYKNGSWKTFTPADGLVSYSVESICQSSDGALWFGTWGGVSQYRNGIWTNFTTTNGLVSTMYSLNFYLMSLVFCAGC